MEADISAWRGMHRLFVSPKETPPEDRRRYRGTL
jgi:hypothetical protein